MALGELMELLLPYVGRICGPIALQDGPDATQEAMIKILRGIRTLDQPAALFGWARVIAVREAVRLAARRPVTAPLLDEQQAGEILSVQPGTVRSRLFRARTSFRKAWNHD